MSPEHELVVGGQRSGKTGYAESLAARWLAQPDHEASVVVTATVAPGDAEMAARIERHRAIRARTLARAGCIEAPRAIAATIGRHSAPNRLLVVDCLTLWTTNLLFPAAAGLQACALDDEGWRRARAGLCDALRAARGPVLLVSGEAGLGWPPAHAAAGAFTVAIGQLHQDLAGVCARLTWVVAGQACAVKR